jgi:hypothetical protein
VRADSPHPAAGLAEIVRIYGIRHWIAQSCKQVKDQLGWADFQVRSETAIRRPPGPGQLRLQLLLGRLVPRPSCAGPAYGTSATALGRGERGPRAVLPPPAPSWPRALRSIRAWLSASIALQRWWQAWSKAPRPPQLQALINSVAAGQGLHRYIPNEQTTVSVVSQKFNQLVGWPCAEPEANAGGSVR